MHLAHLTTHRLNEVVVVETKSKVAILSFKLTLQAIWDALFSTLIEETEQKGSVDGPLMLAIQETVSVEDKENESTSEEKDEKPPEKRDSKGKQKGKGDKNKNRSNRRDKGEQGLADNTNTQKKSIKPRNKTSREIANLFVEQLVEESISHLMRMTANEYHSSTSLKDLSRGMELFRAWCLTYTDYTPTSDEDVIQKPHLSFCMWLLGFIVKAPSKDIAEAKQPVFLSPPSSPSVPKKTSAPQSMPNGSSRKKSGPMSEKYLRALFPWINHALRTPHMSIKEKLYNLVAVILRVGKCYC